MMKKLLILSLTMFYCTSPLASNHATPYVNITEIRSLVDGNVFITVANENAMCGTNVFLLQVNNESSQATYSNLLAAATTKKKIKIENWSGCAEGGWGSLAEAISVQY